MGWKIYNASLGRPQEEQVLEALELDDIPLEPLVLSEDLGTRGRHRRPPS